MDGWSRLQREEALFFREFFSVGEGKCLSESPKANRPFPLKSLSTHQPSDILSKEVK
ncbi:hypothetical protein KR50_37240 [Jeotgalibacillus campisalis]|uniref:Uncharacterized protein n=1 Tax=Jeotgalibacillus campisalis TaxID=220754 RepID=A0A0C2VFL2_9BACL|nr:hypothetical protein KR50_37240 [Jeotgalibacillus campisalis]